MIRGNAVIIKTIVLISLTLLVNISYANEISHSEADKNKAAIQPKATSKNSLNTDAPAASTQSTLESHAEIGVSNYVQMLFGLFAIIVFIFAVAWLIKRVGTLNPNHSNNLKIIAGLNVGQREKIVVVQVMDEQLLVGITQSNIQLLSKLEQPIPAPNMHSLGGFQEKLQSAMSSFTKKTTTGNDA